jgi:RND family efflux transporter MFP subunit
VPTEVEAIGTVRARVSTVVASQLPAYVREVRVTEGSRVAAGDLLIRLDDADVRAQLRRAEAGLGAARAAREEALQTIAESEARSIEARAALAEARTNVDAARRMVDDAEAALVAAEAQAALAASTHERYRRLLGEGVVSRQEYEETTARDRTAAADVLRARARLEVTRNAVSQGQSRVSQAESAVAASDLRTAAARRRAEAAEARVGEAEAEAARAEVQLAYSRITAPGPGLVVEKSVEVGDLAMPGKPLLRIDDPAGYRLEAQLASSDAASVRLGQAVPVSVGSLGALPARVGEIVPAADPATRTITVKLDLPPAPGVRGGLYGTARFTVGQAERLVLPLSAVVERGQLTGAYVVEADRARLRYVTLGPRRGGGVEVLSGLGAGERVVVEGAGRLRDGAPVEVGP